MQHTALSETGAFETGAFETGAFAAFEPILFRLDAFPATQTVPARKAASGTAALRRKTLARTPLRKWDMIAVIALMLTCAVYGVYALFFLTGF